MIPNDAVIGLVQRDSDPRPGLVGTLPRHGQPVRRLDLGHVTATLIAITVVDDQSSAGPISDSTAVPTHRDCRTGPASPDQTVSMGAWND